MSAAALVRQSREAAGLSRRVLAARAGVPISTVSRIEDGSSDPTLTMLARLVAAAGRHLTVAADPVAGRLAVAGLADACTRTSGGDRQVAWHRIRGLLDQLAAHPEQTAAAIADPPARTGDAGFDALLAGIAEKLADDAGLPRPRWVRSVPASPAPWEAPGTPSRVQRARERAPEQLRARNIWLAAGDLWRDAA